MTGAPALVVVEDADGDRPLLERARAFAAGDDREVIVLALATPDEYDDIAETLEAIGETENTSYDSRDVLAGIAGDVESAAEDVFDGGVAVSVRTVVAGPDEQADRIVAVAEDAGCDHVFLRGRRRSPTGKVVFGDRTQGVILSFDGYVTVTTT